MCFRNWRGWIGWQCMLRCHVCVLLISGQIFLCTVRPACSHLQGESVTSSTLNGREFGGSDSGFSFNSGFCDVALESLGEWVLTFRYFNVLTASCVVRFLRNIRSPQRRSVTFRKTRSVHESTFCRCACYWQQSRRECAATATGRRAMCRHSDEGYAHLPCTGRILK
jgi:hypothetical protein